MSFSRSGMVIIFVIAYGHINKRIFNMHYRLIGAATGWGAQIRECELGPVILKEGRIVEKLREKQVSTSDLKILYPEKKASEVTLSFPQALPLIHEFNLRLSKKVKGSLKEVNFRMVRGGNNSIEMETGNGVNNF